MFGAPGPFGPGGIPRGANGAKRSNYSYASSVVSQDVGIAGTDTSSVVGGSAASIAYSQSDRLRRRSSFGSVAGTSELGSLSQYDYKSQDEAADLDDMKSQYAGTQSGVTVF
jgi:regulator of nonsense transcripts 1